MSTLFLEDLRLACNRANSFTRVEALLSRYPGERSKLVKDWFIALGENWTWCDTIFRGRFLLTKLFRRHPAAWRFMMDHHENTVFDALAEKTTVYRGCGPMNRMGLSWSLDPNVARKFPTLDRYRQAAPLLITASIPKKRIVAVKLDRNESEVIALVHHLDIVLQEPIGEVTA